MLTVEQLTVEQRLAKLEATARRWRLAALGLAGVVVLGVGMGADGDAFPKIIRANMFEAVDSNGTVVGQFGIARVDGVPGFVVKSKDGKSNTMILPGGPIGVTNDGNTSFVK